MSFHVRQGQYRGVRRDVMFELRASSVRPAFAARDIDTFRGILGDLVPQRPHRDAEQACRRGTVSTGKPGRKLQLPLGLLLCYHKPMIKSTSDNTTPRWKR